MDLKKSLHGGFTYYLSDPHPSALIISGMHGDEFESGKLLEELFTARVFPLPSYLFIPQISPSAVSSHTRLNGQQHDINRQFRKDTDDEEAKAVMELLAPFRFRSVVDVHEDPDRTNELYLYDTKQMTHVERAAYEDSARQTGVGLYTGIDDENDPTLQSYIKDGYLLFDPERVSADSGFLSIWMARLGIAKRVFTLEIPGKAPKNLKRMILTLLLPYLSTL